jgi:chromosome segregation protein
MGWLSVSFPIACFLNAPNRPTTGWIARRISGTIGPMHIQQIEIDNFKSFAGRTVIPFRRGFTTVSGPNGSGKSNIVDSVLFCLGLSSSRTMRAEKLTDLINNTSHIRKREATVTITFNKGLSDPPLPAELLTTLDPLSPELLAAVSDEPVLIPLDDTAPDPTVAAVDDADLVTVSRRIKESPSGYSSTYYLNGKVSTLTEIHEFLLRFNVSPGCYNVMMQGDVASIVNMSPLERRKILDELAGIADFDRKIEQAEAEMLTTQQTVERNEILLGEIDTRLEQLSGERDKALKYQALKTTMGEWESKRQLAQLKALEDQLALARENVVQAQEQRKQAHSALESLRTEISQATQTLLSLNEAVKRKGEDQHLAIQKQVESLRSHLARKQDAIKFIDDKQKEARQTIAKLTADTQRLTQVLETFDQELALLAVQETELQTLLTAEQANVDAVNSRIDNLTDDQSEFVGKRAHLRQSLEAVEDSLATLQRQRLEWADQRERLSKDSQRQQQSVNDLDTKHQSLQRRYDGLAKEFEALDELKQTQEDDLKRLGIDRGTLQSALNRATERVATLGRELMRLEAQHKAYQDVHFGRSIDVVLGANLPGVHGTISQLATVDEQYSLALEIALGGRVQNIVVDDDRVAQQGIELLKQQRAGRATFLPLTKIRRNQRLGAAPGHPGVVDYAYNLMRFVGQYDDIFGFALGDTLIVEDMACARPLLSRYRMVTLDGSLLEKTGAMTGGSSAQRGGGKLMTSGVNDAELATLKQSFAQAQQDQDRIGKQLSQAQAEWETLQEAQRTTWQRHSRLLAELESLEGQMTDVAKEREGLLAAQVATTEGKALEQRLAELTASEQVLEKQWAIQQAEQNRLAVELSDLDSQMNHQQLEALRNDLTEARFQLDYYDTQLRNCKTQIHQKQVERQIRDGAKADHAEQLILKEAQIVQFEGEKATHLADIEATTAQVAELELQIDALGDELKSLRAERDEAQTALLNFERAKSDRERKVAQADEQINACKARTYELDPQARTLRHALTAQGLEIGNLAEADLPTPEAIDQAVGKTQRAMQALEPVNMLAIAEFDTVNERKQELAGKVDTLTRERENLTVKIAGYEDLKRIYFMKAFEAVNQQFKEIYAELSDGHGQLILTQPDNPLAGGLTIEASPRGKKTQRLEAMSGGEKSLTSLAFVFSLQRYSPAPFYALDEVDQNLDGLNVEKLARMVLRESGAAQFIVVSLRKPMIENSDRTVGVTQKKNGISKVTGIQLRADNVTGSLVGAV